MISVPDDFLEEQMAKNKQEKELGMLLGLHAGDSLGATLEFMFPSDNWFDHREIIGGGQFGWKAGDATDDTDLMIALLKSLDSRQMVDLNHFKLNLVAWADKEPVDIGLTTKSAVACIKAATELESLGRTSESNGSLMRSCPLALLDVPADTLKRFINDQTKVTHLASNVLLADEIFILTLQAAIKGASKSEIKEFALSWCKEKFPAFHYRLTFLDKIKWKDLPTSGFVLDTLFAAFWALEQGTSFQESLTLVVNRGDDSDTAGAVAGALCGAFYGVNGIPKRWVTKLQYQKEIKKIYKKID